MFPTPPLNAAVLILLESKLCHFVVDGILHESAGLHVGFDFRQLFEPIQERAEIRVRFETVGLQNPVLVEKLVHDKVNEGNVGSCEPVSFAEEVREHLEGGWQLAQVVALQLVEVWVVAEPHYTVPEVHGLFGHHVHADLLFFSLSEKVILPGDVSEDGVALGDLDVAIYKVRQVGKIKPQGEFVVEPTRLVELGRGTARKKLVLEFCPGVFQKQADGLGKPSDVPVGKCRRSHF